MHRRFHAHHAPDGDGSGNGGGGTATANQPPADHGMPKWETELRTDNAKLREQRRELRAEVEALKKQIPGEGAVVLTGADAAAWEAVKALPVKPGELAGVIEERDALKATIAQRDREKLHHDAAEALGWKPTVLTKLAATEGLHIEMKEAEVEEKDSTGKTVKVKKPVPHVRPAADEKAALVPLASFAEEQLGDFLPALRAEAARGGGTAANGSGVQYPEQRGRGTAPGGLSEEQLLAAKRRSGIYSAPL